RDSIGVILHSTKIAQFWPSGKVRLDTGGWMTVTTKARINNLLPLPWNIASVMRTWYVYYRGEKIEPFFDGITFNLESGGVAKLLGNDGDYRDNPAGQLWYPGGVAIGRYKMGEAGMRYYVIPVEATVGWDFPTLV